MSIGVPGCVVQRLGGPPPGAPVCPMIPETVSREPIAIVGLGCVLPDAPDVATFWQNLLEGKSSIREVAKERWDPALFWSPDKSAADKTYAKIGAFVTDDAFQPLDYKVPP